jgi:DNA-binding protein HU-beta
MIMRKPELVDTVRAALRLGTKAEAERAVTAVLDAIAFGLVGCGEVQVIRWGKFRVAERKNQDPFGRPVTYKTIVFSAGSELKAAIQ